MKIEQLETLRLGEFPNLVWVRLHTDEGLVRSLQGYRGSGVETRAIPAVDIALWDLLGRAGGMPLYQVLGGASRPAIRTYNTCAGYR